MVHQTNGLAGRCARGHVGQAIKGAPYDSHDDCFAAANSRSHGEFKSGGAALGLIRPVGVAGSVSSPNTGPGGLFSSTGAPLVPL